MTHVAGSEHAAPSNVIRVAPRAVARRPALVGSIWIAAAQGASLLATFVLLKLVATIAHPARFGVFSLVLAVAGAAGVLVFGPLGQWALRHYQEAKERAALHSYFAAAGIGAGLGTVVLVLGSLPLLLSDSLLARLGLGPGLVVLGLSIGIIGGVGDVCIAISNAGLHRGIAGALLVGQSVTRPLAVAVAWWLGATTVFAWAGALAAASLAFLLVEVVVVVKCDAGLHRHRSEVRRQLAELARYVAPFVVWGVPAYAISFGDRMLVGYFANPRVLGLYVALTTATTSVANGLGATMNRVFEPVVFHRAGDGSDRRRVREAHSLVDLTAVLILVLTGAAVLVTWATPAFVLRLFTSSQYTDGADQLWYLALAAAAFLLGQQLILRGLIAKRPWLYVPAKFVHAGTLVAALAVLVPARGLAGVAEAVLLAQIVQLVVVIATNRLALGGRVS